MAQVSSLLTIQSSNSSRVLRVQRLVDSYLTVSLKGHQVSGAVEVWVETGDIAGLVHFFRDLGGLESPWKGSRTWASLEGDLELSATCSSLGAVKFHVRMSGLPGAAEEWALQAGIETEFGQLPRLASEAQALGGYGAT